MRKIIALLVLGFALHSGPAVAQDAFVATKPEVDSGTTTIDASATTVAQPTGMNVRDICVVNTGSTNELKFTYNGGEYMTAPTGNRGYCIEKVGRKNNLPITVGVKSANGVQTTYEIIWIGSGT